MPDPNTSHVQAVVEWINKECKPRESTGIKSFVSQNGRSAPYEFHVWCRKDGSTTTWELLPRDWPRNDQRKREETIKEISEQFKTGNLALIGFIFGQAGDTVFLVKTK